MTGITTIIEHVVKEGNVANINNIDDLFVSSRDDYEDDDADNITKMITDNENLHAITGIDAHTETAGAEVATTETAISTPAARYGPPTYNPGNNNDAANDASTADATSANNNYDGDDDNYNIDVDIVGADDR